MTTTRPALIVQPRDHEVFMALAENGVMDTVMIHEEYFGQVTERRCRQRLSLYQEHGLTKVLSLRLWTSEHSRRAPTVHCLTERGADFVQSLDGTRPLRVTKGEPQPSTIHHRLDIVRSKLRFDAACRRCGLTLPEWILEQDRDPFASDDLPPNQRRKLYHAFNEAPRSTCQPDAAFRLAVPKDITNPKLGTTDVIGLFEIDCSTEGRKQIAAKLPGYTQLISTRAFQRYFPNSDKAVVRVFWICRTWARIHSLCQKLANDPVSAYFRFTTLDDLTSAQTLTAPIWHATDGKRREIIRLPTT